MRDARRELSRRTRREVILSLGVATCGWASPIRAQQTTSSVIGYLNAAREGDSAELLAAFKLGLADGGHVEGKNVAIEYRWADDQYDRLLGLAKELVDRQVDIIAATSTPVALAARKATAIIPIAFTVGSDPVKNGLVKSLNRPGGNVTGVTRLNVDLVPKRLQLLKEFVPNITTVGLLVNPTNPNTSTVLRNMQEAAKVLGLQFRTLRVRSDAEFGAAFGSLAQLGAGALVIANDPFFNSRVEELADLTIRSRMPAVYQYHRFVAAGGLMSYGASNTDSHRKLGVYVSRILAGTKPGDLPVEQSTKLDLIINLKTARTLGFVVPASLLARADEVIE